MTDLSHAGLARRQAMLDELLDNMTQHHARRAHFRRSAGVVAILALVASITWLSTMNGSRPTGSTTHIAILKTNHASIAAWITRTDGSALARAVESVELPNVIIERIDDDELLGVLASIDRPAGLMRTADRVMLTRSVADPW